MAAKKHLYHCRQDQRGASSERFAVSEALPPGHRTMPDPNGQVDEIVYRENAQLIIDRDEMIVHREDQLWTMEDHNGDPDSSDDDWDENHFLLFGPRQPPLRDLAWVDWEPPPPPQDPRLHHAPPGPDLTVNQDNAGTGNGTWTNRPWYNHNQSNQWQHYHADSDDDGTVADWNARPRWNEPDTDNSWQSQNTWWNQQHHHWQTPNQWY